MNRRTALIELHIAVFLVGFTGLFGQLISASPMTIVIGRTVFAALAIFVGLVFTRTSLAVTSRRAMGILFISGVVLAAHWVTFFHAIQSSTVAIGLVGFSTFPLFVTFFEPLFFKQRLRAIDILCAAVVAVGLVIVDPSFDLSNRGTVGLLWAILSGFLYAVLTLLNRRLVEKNSFLVVAFYQHCFAALTVLPFAIIYTTVPESKNIWLLLVLGVLLTALPQTLFIKSLKLLKAQLASIITGLEPVYGIILAAIFLGEIPNWHTITGTGIIFGAVFLSMKVHAES